MNNLECIIITLYFLISFLIACAAFALLGQTIKEHRVIERQEAVKKPHPWIWKSNFVYGNANRKISNFTFPLRKVTMLSNKKSVEYEDSLEFYKAILGQRGLVII